MPKAVFASVERVKSSDTEANADLFMFFKNKGGEGILLKVKDALFFLSCWFQRVVTAVWKGLVRGRARLQTQQSGLLMEEEERRGKGSCF